MGGTICATGTVPVTLPYHQSLLWFGVALDPTVWDGGLKFTMDGCLAYNSCLASANQIWIFFKARQLPVLIIIKS